MRSATCSSRRRSWRSSTPPPLPGLELEAAFSASSSHTVGDFGRADEPGSPGGFVIDAEAEASARAQEVAGAADLDERMGRARAAREASEAATAAAAAAAVAAVPQAPLHSGTPPAAQGVQWAAAERVLQGEEREGTEGATGVWAVDYDDTRVGPEVLLRHFILPQDCHPDHVRAARGVYKRRLDAACRNVADTIDAQGSRPLAGLQTAASLFVQALADRRVRELDEAKRGWCDGFGGNCLPWHRLAGVLGPSLGSDERGAARRGRPPV